VSRKLAPWSIAVAAATITAVTAASAAADAIIDPAPIGPHQYFFGEVNGQAGHATIKVLLAPVPPTSDLGFTGSAAHAIDVRFPTPTVAKVPVVLRDYSVTSPIPVSLILPCAGRGKVAFVPDPTSQQRTPRLCPSSSSASASVRPDPWQCRFVSLTWGYARCAGDGNRIRMASLEDWAAIMSLPAKC
jgi:hypothetical protein